MESGYVFGQDTFFAVGPARGLVVAAYTNSHPTDETGLSQALNTVVVSLVHRYA